jgi:hypothetical protein
VEIILLGRVSLESAWIYGTVFAHAFSVEIYTRSAKRDHDLVTIRYVRDLRLLIICMDFETGTIHSFSWDQFNFDHWVWNFTMVGVLGRCS